MADRAEAISMSLDDLSISAEEWAGWLGLKRSGRRKCLASLVRARCMSACRPDLDHPLCALTHRNMTILDHLSIWNRDGRPAVLVAQPYGLRRDGLELLGQLEREHGLSVEVDALGWHYPGHVVRVEIWAPGVERRRA
jgi:hypothetical protein